MRFFFPLPFIVFFAIHFLFLAQGTFSIAQVNPDSITIVRDKWGVPHIYAKTDAEAAYGLAWANAEDDFKSMQETLLAVRKKLSEVKGKEGAKMDVMAHLVGLDEAVDHAYDTAFSPQFKKVLEAYASSINNYAKKHPEEVLLKNLSLPQYINPDCGYLFNTNNTCSNATCLQNNLNLDKINATMGYLQEDNNRSLRLKYLFAQYDKISFEDLKKIKYDVSFMDPLYTFFFANINDMLHLDTEKYPDLAESIRFIRTWDKTATLDNRPASLLTIAFGYLATKMFEQGRIPSVHKNFVEEKLLAESLRYAKNHLKKYYGSINVPLGEVQRHIRGNMKKNSKAKNLPVAGAPDVLAAVYTQPYKNGRFKMRAGESYIEMVRFTSNGVEIETVNAYGASAKPDSPHYTDQMEMFVKQQLKPMTLNKEKIIKEAERIYCPK